MTPDSIFTIACDFSALGWIAIIVFSPFWKNFDKAVIGIVVVAMALTYTALNLSDFSPDIFKKFATLDGVVDLFQSKTVVTAAWTHFLAFDLMVAVWIKKNSLKHGISHWLIIVPLIFTCALGPVGFLLYLLARLVKTKNYFAANEMQQSIN